MAGQVWSVNTSGGYMYALNLSRQLRMAVQPIVKFRQFCDVKDAAHQGLHRGDTFHWNVFSDVGTQGATLTETNTIPETSFTISQGTMTITEAGNSVPWTGKLDDLSEQPVAEVIRKVLKTDAKKAFDNLASAQFNSAVLRVVPTTGTDTSAVTLTTNGTATLTNSIALGKEHVKSIVDVMKELPATLMLRPFNFNTLATRAYGYASDEMLEPAALWCLAIVVVGLTPVVLLNRQLRQAHTRQETPSHRLMPVPDLPEAAPAPEASHA